MRSRKRYAPAKLGREIAAYSACRLSTHSTSSVAGTLNRLVTFLCCRISTFVALPVRSLATSSPCGRCGIGHSGGFVATHSDGTKSSLLPRLESECWLCSLGIGCKLAACLPIPVAAVLDGEIARMPNIPTTALAQYIAVRFGRYLMAWHQRLRLYISADRQSTSKSFPGFLLARCCPS